MRLAQIFRQAPWAVVALVVLAIALAVLPIALLPEGPTAAQTALTSVGSVVLLVFALFSLVHDTFSAWQLVTALCVLVLLVGGALLGWRIVEQTRPLTVTDAVKLTGAKSLRDGDTAVLTLRVPTPRDRLRVTFGAKDLAYGSPCAPTSSLRITGGAPGDPQEAEIGEEASIALDRGDRSVRLEVELVTDTDCELRLRIGKAVLDNH